MTVPAEVLDVAAVVTGGQSLPLTGWQRRDAIRAMHALDWLPDRIQHALCIRTRKHLTNVASLAGVRLGDNDDQPDLVAVAFVRAGTWMPLRGADQAAAIAALARDGKSVPEIADRLRLSYGAAEKATERLGVHTLPYDQQLSARPVSVAA
jgi:hypothetical protein